MFEIAFGIILAIILISILVYFLGVLIDLLDIAIFLIIGVGVFVSILFGCYYVFQKIAGIEIDIGEFFGFFLIAVIVAALFFTLVSFFWNLGHAFFYVVRNVCGVASAEATELSGVEKISEYVEATLRSTLGFYLQDGRYQIVRDRLRNRNILVKTDTGNIVAAIENYSAEEAGYLSANLSVYGDEKSKKFGEGLSPRSAASKALKLVTNHAAAHINS